MKKLPLTEPILNNLVESFTEFYSHSGVEGSWRYLTILSQNVSNYFLTNSNIILREIAQRVDSKIHQDISVYLIINIKEKTVIKQVDIEFLTGVVIGHISKAIQREKSIENYSVSGSK